MLYTCRDSIHDKLLSDRYKADKVYHKRIKEVYARVCACAKWERMIKSENI